MTNPRREIVDVMVRQSDLAAIMYSSGTTGKIKGVMITHRSLIAMTGSFTRRNWPVTLLQIVPYFHVFGFHYIFKCLAMNETVVIMESYAAEKMIDAVEKYKVTDLIVAPPAVVAMTKRAVTDGRDLSSLEMVMSGGAPLGKELIAAFTAKFPGLFIRQVSRDCISKTKVCLDLGFENCFLTIKTFWLLVFYVSEKSLVLDLLLGLQRKSNDCEKEYYKNKT